MQGSRTPPETRYTKSGDVHIAYQIVGNGPLDLVVVPGFISHVEWLWEEPACARFLSRLGSFARLILFDKRGTGLSDRVPQVPTLEQRMDDVRAVLDAARSYRAAIIGVSEGGPLSVMFAATYPERTAALVLYGSFAEFSSVATPQELEFMLQFMDKAWGTGLSLLRFAPSMADDESFRQWWARFERLAASPGAAMAGAPDEQRDRCPGGAAGGARPNPCPPSPRRYERPGGRRPLSGATDPRSEIRRPARS